MDATKKQKLFDKNRKIIEMVIERAKRDFPDDIALIGLTGSFRTGDFHEKSDLDLIIVNNTQKGWEISACFILDDVGYDIYCTPWETRINDQANLDSPMVSGLVDLEILYVAKPEYVEKFKSYRDRALEKLAKPIGKDCIERARKLIATAKQHYADAVLSDDLNTVKFAAAQVLCNLVNALVHLNNTYFTQGVKRYLEQVGTFAHKPADFEQKYMAVVRATTIADARTAAFDMLAMMVVFCDDMTTRFVEKPVPTFENLRGTYEELWCNYRNKAITATQNNDVSYAFHAAKDAQEYLDLMTELNGTPKIELMIHLDADNLGAFREAFLSAMDEYLSEYSRVGREVERFESFEQLYEWYMTTS